MSDRPSPGLLARFFLAWAAYFRTLFDPEFAAGVLALREGRLALPPSGAKSSDVEARAERAASSGGGRDDERAASASTGQAASKKDKDIGLREAAPEGALQLLALLQREGRFVDFVEEDVSSFGDAQIGAAARVVHEGCRKALREHLPVEPVRSEEEGSKIRLEKGFDAARVRLTGNVTGEPPYVGTLVHRGWRVREVKLPKMTEGHDASIVAPAEVEL